MNMNKKKLPKAIQHPAPPPAGASDHEAPARQMPVSRVPLDAGVPQIDTLMPADIDEKRRRSQAHAIVERYANFSAVGGIIPLPLVNVAAVTTLIVRMVKLLSNHYGVAYQHGRARALVVGLAAGSMPTTASAVTTSTLTYIVPGVNLLGLAVSSVTASVCARGIGRRFVEHFESGGTLAEFPVIDRR